MSETKQPAEKREAKPSKTAQEPNAGAKPGQDEAAGANGGPGRLASEGGLDDTEDPNDSGGKKAPADPNKIAPKR